MKCSDINKKLLNEALKDQDKVTAIEDHINSCSSCREKYGFNGSLADILIDVLRNSCLSQEDLQKYSDGDIPVEEKYIFDLHLNDCEMCRAALQDLENIASGCFDDISKEDMRAFEEEITHDEPRLLAAKGSIALKKSKTVLGIGVSKEKSDGDILECIAKVFAGKGNFEIIGSQVEETEIGGKKTKLTLPFTLVQKKIKALFLEVGFFKKHDCFSKNIIVEVRYKGSIVEADSLELAVATAIYRAMSDSVLNMDDVVFSGSLDIDGRVRKIDGLSLKAKIAWKLGGKVLVLPKENENDPDLKNLDSTKEGNLKIFFFDKLEEVFDFLNKNFSVGEEPEATKLEKTKHPQKRIPEGKAEVTGSRKRGGLILPLVLALIFVLMFLGYNSYVTNNSEQSTKKTLETGTESVDAGLPAWSQEEEKLFQELLKGVPNDFTTEYPHIECFEESSQSNSRLLLPLLIGLAQGLSTLEFKTGYAIDEGIGFMRVKDSKTLSATKSSAKEFEQIACENIIVARSFLEKALNKNNNAIVPALCCYLHQDLNYQLQNGLNAETEIIKHIRGALDSVINGSIDSYIYREFTTLEEVKNYACRKEDRFRIPLFIKYNNFMHKIRVPFYSESEKEVLMKVIPTMNRD